MKILGFEIFDWLCVDCIFKPILEVSSLII
jgi:hypothetical protein